MNNPTKSLTMSRITLIAVPFIILLGALWSPASARAEEKSVIVEYADLDLSSTAGQSELDRRIDRAVRQACRSRFSRSVRSGSETRACIVSLQQDVQVARNRAVAHAAMERRAEQQARSVKPTKNLANP